MSAKPRDNISRVRFQEGEAADCIREDAAELMQLAVEYHGDLATLARKGFSLESAAAHEAGHAIVYVLAGDPVHGVKVERTNQFGLRVWGGLTDGGRTWSLNDETPTVEIVHVLRNHLAGLAGEVVALGPGAAIGSSVDEVALARAFCGRIAKRYGLESPAVFLNAFDHVCADIFRHRTHHDAIRVELAKRRSVRGARLARLLPPRPRENPAAIFVDWLERASGPR